MSLKRLHAVVLTTAALCLLSVLPPRAQAQTPAGPRIPYEDIGACPFECCTYREWTATEKVTVWRDRKVGSGIAFVAEPDERVRAITGVVVTTRPGRAVVRKAVDLWTTAGPLHIKPGETLYLLTPHGEGSMTAWFKGRIYDQVDASDFTTINAVCTGRPERCNGRVVQTRLGEWWVRLKNSKSVTGWTREPEKFDNKDSCG